MRGQEVTGVMNIMQNHVSRIDVLANFTSEDINIPPETFLRVKGGIQKKFKKFGPNDIGFTEWDYGRDGTLGGDNSTKLRAISRKGVAVFNLVNVSSADSVKVVKRMILEGIEPQEINAVFAL